MTRGNQREKAREKAAKKAKGQHKAADKQDGNKGLTLEERRARDADIMRQKQQKKLEQAGAGSAGAGSAGAGSAGTESEEGASGGANKK